MSENNGKVKIIRNLERNKTATYKPYVPQYQVHGKEPAEYHSGMIPGNVILAKPSPLPLDNPRAKRPAVRQPYAVETSSPVGRGRGPVPNVGNNMEHTWSSVDSEVIDDLSGQVIDPNQVMVDNNDFVSDAALGLPPGTGGSMVNSSGPIEYQEWQNGANASDINPTFEQHPPIIEEEPKMMGPRGSETEDLFNILGNLTDDTYLLIVDSVPICSGPMEEIQDQARALVFGEHSMCDGNPVPVDDIVILRKVKVKVGLFLE
jgi:hypothetical protein